MKAFGPKLNLSRSRVGLWSGVVCLALAVVAIAQTLPGTAAPGNPFEVHGLLYSGSAPAGYPLGDGWAQGTSFLGVLDENGYPAVDANGVLFRASRQVDGNWGTEGDVLDSTVFAGSNKNSDLIGPTDAPWEWEIGSGGPQKNDLTNAYFHTRVDPLTGDRWVFVAAETRSIDGESHVDFEFNQAGITKTGTTSGALVGLGPDGGRTLNDFLINMDYEKGGEHPVATVRFWNGSAFELVSAPGSVFSATNFADIPHGADGSWKHFSDDGAEVDVLTRLQFVEGAANLSALGIGVDACATDATFIVKTRSSASWTSELKDFAIVSFPLEPAPQLEITAPESVCTQSAFQVSVQETTGLHNTTYTWVASGCGSIISDPAATTITVQADPVCDCTINLSVTVVGGECRHTVSARTTVAVGDDAYPVLSSRPADVIVECDSVPAPAELSASDDCSDVEVSFSETVVEGACMGSSTISRTWTTSDQCENVTSHTQVVTVQDTTAPLLSGVPAGVIAACDAIPPAADVTASDNCSAAMVELSEVATPGICQGESSIARTWTASDACGNEASQTQNITVVDEVAPVMTGVPADMTAECDALPKAPQVTATDNCSTPTVQLEELAEPGVCRGESTVTRTWTATDACGNWQSQFQIISVVDTTVPVLIGVPANATVECDSIPQPPVVTATDNCSDAVVGLLEEVTPGPFAGKSQITRIWTATDECGNQTRGMQVIAVIDTTAPVLRGVPDDVTVECDSIPEPAVVTATDNCAEATVGFDEQTGAGDCTGRLIITRTWTATDACGNQTTQSQTITVVDTTPPTFDIAPADITAECDAVPPPAAVTATDNCSTATVGLVEVEEPGDCPDALTLTRTWTATDDCGNRSSHVQVVTILDTTDPVISAHPEDIAAKCDSVPRAVSLSAADNCDSSVPVSFREDKTPGACAGDYDLLRTWTALDDCGNEASVDQLVSVSDTTAPRITMDSGRKQFICDGVPVHYAAQTSDNCVAAQLTGSSILAVTADSLVRVTVSPLPDDTVTITTTGPAMILGSLDAADECGNVSDPFKFAVLAVLGQEACSPGYWRNHPERWAAAGYAPSDRFLYAFQITDLSSPEIPAGFDEGLTLGQVLATTGGSFNQMLVQGTAALLNASHPSIEFPTRAADVIAIMQAAFAGKITFDRARAAFASWNAAEGECGCPIN